MIRTLDVYFETYGCTANHNSTEIMKGLIYQTGLNITSNINLADIIVINSCIAKEPTEEKIRRKVQDLLSKERKIILAGCMAKINHKKFQHRNLFLLDTHNIKKINELIRNIIKENIPKPEKYFEIRNEVKVNLPKISKEKYIGITQISEGCLGKCSYCLTKIAKGKLFSYPQKAIIQSIKKDIQARCKEIWITSQDNAAYGNDTNEYKLPELMDNILKIKQKFFVRIGLMNPNNVLNILPELINVYRHHKMFKFLHIPIQAGSDRILRKMKRNYSVKDVLRIISEFRKEFPHMHISTDIIVGFPGETEKDFEQTLSLIKRIKPETLNVNKYWSRPNTSASKLKQINYETKNNRSKILSKLHFEICKNNQETWKDWEGKVIVDKKGFENTYLARSQDYKLFAIYSKEKILGKILNIKVKKPTPHYLISEKI
jgi:MiaB-like tRNA modifying enzyme